MGIGGFSLPTPNKLALVDFVAVFSTDCRGFLYIPSTGRLRGSCFTITSQWAIKTNSCV